MRIHGGDNSARIFQSVAVGSRTLVVQQWVWLGHGCEVKKYSTGLSGELTELEVGLKQWNR